MFPLHTWLPDAHVEAPTAGSVILAGVLLKMGTYGFIRFAVPFFPEVALSATVSNIVVALAVIGIVYGALVAMVQPDIKKLVAYSSVSHLGFVMLGIWAGTVQSLQGALMVMIGHGISTGALFFIVGMLYERRHTREIADFGGLAKVVPALAAVFTVVALSSIGLPGLNGFVGEFLVLLGSYGTYPDRHDHRDHRRDFRRGIPALGAAADHLPAAGSPGEREAAGPESAGVGGADPAADRHRVDGTLSASRARPDGAGSQALHRVVRAGTGRR